MSDTNYYAIVTFGSPSYGRIRSYYRSQARAVIDAQAIGGGSLSAVRVVACPSRQAAIEADVSDSHQVVWTR